MELRDKAKAILAHLIKNRFDRLNTCGLLTTGPDLINIAKEAGLPELAAEMEDKQKRTAPANIVNDFINHQPTPHMEAKTFICNLYNGTEYNGDFAILTITKEFAREILQKYSKATRIFAEGYFTRLAYGVAANKTFCHTNAIGEHNIRDRYWEELADQGNFIELYGVDVETTDMDFLVIFHRNPHGGNDYLTFHVENTGSSAEFETGSFTIGEIWEIAEYPTKELYVLTEGQPTNEYMTYYGQLLWKHEDGEHLTDGKDIFPFKSRTSGSGPAFMAPQSDNTLALVGKQPKP